MEKTVKTYSEKETTEIAEKITKEAIKKENFGRIIIFLEGGLGAGKTVFTKGIARALNIKDTTISPTFVFVREYDGQIPLYHFDLYRIEDAKELDDLGFFEYMDKNGIMVIEWAEKLESIVSPDILIRIKKISENEREIAIIWTQTS